MFFGLIGVDMKVTPEHKKILHDLSIDNTHPDSLLHDFQVMIDVFREKEQTLTPKFQIPLKLVNEINKRLKNPIKLGLKRPQQKSYPRIEGLYLVLRASGLSSISHSGKKPKLVFDEDWLEQWQSLSPTDKYCHLLESWLTRGYDIILGGREVSIFGLPRVLEKVISCFNHIPQDGFKFKSYNEFREEMSYFPETYNLGLMDLFGMVTLHEGAVKEGDGWQVQKVERTALGEALLTVLYDVMYQKLYVDRLKNGESDPFSETEQENNSSFTVLKPHLQEYFPQWQKSLQFKQRDQPTGAFTFEVSLYKHWSANIKIDSQQTLDALANAIINAVQFDSDHLYKFVLQTRFGTEVEIYHSYMDEYQTTDETRLADLYLKPDSHMTFIFDFGDWWEFEVIVTDHQPEVKTNKVEILSTKGEAPEQYPNWEDYDE